MEIGQKLKDKRTELGLSQEKLAAQLGVTRQTIASWEKGKTYPDINSILKLSDLYHVSLDELLKEDTAMRKHVERTATLTDKAWNSLFVTAALLLPASMLLFHWGLEAAGSAAKILGMLLLLLVLIFRWKLSGRKKSELVVGVFFWSVFFIPDLFGLFLSRNEVVKGFTFEYIFFGILLLYSYGVCFQTRLAFLLTIGLYFGTPVFIAISTHLPTILEEGLIQSSNRFGKNYRVEAVLYQAADADVPSMITLDPDGETLLIDQRIIGQFTKMESESGDTTQTWKLIPVNDPIGRVTLSSRKTSDLLTLEYWIDTSTPQFPDYYTLLWKIRVSPVQKASFDLKTENGQYSLLMDWYSTEMIPENTDESRSFTLDGHGTASISLADETVTQLTVFEEYHYDGQVEASEYHLERNDQKVFPLPGKVSKRYDGTGQYAVYRISLYGGVYLFRLDYA